MNSRDALRRLQAHQAGKPLPRGERLSFRIADPEDVLILSFVRTGGESRPWGIALGHPHEDPTILSVPEGRDRDLVASMAVDLGAHVLEHLRSPASVRPVPSDETGLSPLRQVWLPNASHLDMLHHLAYAYTFTKSGGDDTAALNALGRTCAWLFRQAQLPGQQHVMVATQALKQGFTFPTEDVRQGHLGYLLAWLETHGARATRREAAMTAERLSVSTTLDPALERDPLESLVEAWRNGGRNLISPEATSIEAVLRGELARRFGLVVRAWQALRADPRRENRIVEELVQRSLTRQWREWAITEAKIIRGERAFVPSVETDRHPAGAAMAFLRQSAAAEFLNSNLLHDDRELLAESIARGDAFSGRVVRVVDEGGGRTTNPVWTLRDEVGGPLRLREEARVCVVGLRRRTGRIRRIHTGPDDERLIDIALTNLKTAVKGATGRDAIPPNNARWVGEPVTFATASSGGIEEAKIKKLWVKDVPGAWLTKSLASEETLEERGEGTEVA